MMMWDQGTHHPGKPWPDAIAELMKQIGADGINGDTQDGVPLAFSLAADKTGHPLAFEPEGGPQRRGSRVERDDLGPVPISRSSPWSTVSSGWRRATWSTSRDRWNRDKTDDLQFAFFNGEGWESWENIWGIWNGITPRDAEATRRIATIERAVAPFLVSPEWEPFYPMHSFGVYASRWPLGDQTVWTIVNRNEYNIDGRQMMCSAPRHALLRPLSRRGTQAANREARRTCCPFDRGPRLRRHPRHSRPSPTRRSRRCMRQMAEMTAEAALELLA